MKQEPGLNLDVPIWDVNIPNITLTAMPKACPQIAFLDYSLEVY